jgi:hypothetical protein
VIGGALAIMGLTRLLQPVLIHLGYRRLRPAQRRHNGDGGGGADAAAGLSRL